MKIVLFLTLFVPVSVSQPVSGLYVSLPADIQSEPYIVEEFKSAYFEVTGKLFLKPVVIKEFVGSNNVSIEMSFAECLSDGINLYIRPTGTSQYFAYGLRDYYSLGIMWITCSGLNVPVETYPKDSLNACFPVICSAGDTVNETSWHCHFFDWHIYDRTGFYQSYSHARIAGLLAGIKDMRYIYGKNSSWDIVKNVAMKTSTNYGEYAVPDGYGKIQPQIAIAFN